MYKSCSMLSQLTTTSWHPICNPGSGAHFLQAETKWSLEFSEATQNILFWKKNTVALPMQDKVKGSLQRATSIPLMGALPVLPHYSFLHRSRGQCWCFQTRSQMTVLWSSNQPLGLNTVTSQGFLESCDMIEGAIKSRKQSMALVLLNGISIWITVWCSIHFCFQLKKKNWAWDRQVPSLHEKGTLLIVAFWPFIVGIGVCSLSHSGVHSKVYT